MNKVCSTGDIFLLFLNSQRGGHLYHGLFNTCLCCATERKYHKPLEIERMMYDVLFGIVSESTHTVDSDGTVGCGEKCGGTP